MEEKNKNSINSENSNIPSAKEMMLDYYMGTEFPSMSRIYDFSSRRTASCYLDTTAVRLPSAIYGASSISNTRLLSEEYLLNFKKSSIDIGGGIGIFEYSKFEARAAISLLDKTETNIGRRLESIKLPDPQKIELSFNTLISKRRSRSSMSGGKLSIEELSTLLYYGDGVTGSKQVVHPEKDTSWPSQSLGEPDPCYLRTAPSAGGLYPIDLYLLLRNVDQLEDGLYRYRPNSHSLTCTKKMSKEDWAKHDKNAESWGANFDSSKINVAIFYVYSLYRNSRKYGDLGLAFGFMEVGMIAQNIHLAAEALNLASSCSGGGSKEACEKLLGVDGMSDHCLHQTLIGMRS